MENAVKKFIGEHDFRNFCKMDAASIHNYQRQIMSFKISPCNERSEGDQLWMMKIKGSSFLWHQVWCLVAVLLLIGQGLESTSVDARHALHAHLSNECQTYELQAAIFQEALLSCSDIIEHASFEERSCKFNLANRT